MAGGIDWFRWHHGTVTDQKLPLVARRAGASVAEVIAVWACLLEAASMNPDERGVLGAEPDFEAMDCALGMADGKAEAIFRAIGARGLVDEHLQITAWPRRQPKREREDDTAADRKRKQREREADQATPDGASNDDVTPRHATSRQETPREEESREEEKEPSGSSSAGADRPPALKAVPLACPHERIRAIYDEVLPGLPKVRLWSRDRQATLKARWEEMARHKGWATAEEGVAWFRRFFEAVAQDDWLMGRAGRSPGHENWECTIDYLLSPKGFRKVFEGAGRVREAA